MRDVLEKYLLLLYSTVCQRLLEKYLLLLYFTVCERCTLEKYFCCCTLQSEIQSVRDVLEKYLLSLYFTVGEIYIGEVFVVVLFSL